MNVRRLVDCPHCGNFVRLAANPLDTQCPFCGDGVCVERGCSPAHGRSQRLAVRMTQMLLGSAAATVLAACYGLPDDYYPYDAELDVPVDGDASMDAATDSAPSDAGPTDTDLDASDGSGEAPDADPDAADGSGEAPDAASDAGADGA